MKVLDSIATVGRARDRDRDRPPTERLQNIALAVLGVVAVVGVVFVLRGPGASDDPGPSPVVEVTPTVSDEPSQGEPSQSASAEPTAPPETEPTTVLLDAEGALRMRAPVVECAPGLEPLVVQFSTGGGEWETSSVPELVTATGLHVAGDGFARLVGHDPECTPASYVSRDNGATWTPVASEARFWSVLPENDDQVASPTGVVDVPCVPRGVSAINSTVARVWCDTGRIVGTADGGENWVALGSLVDAESVAYLDAANGVALAVDPRCDGISVLVTRDGGVDWETVHCAEISGPWGLLTDPTTITVVGGEDAETSDDVGETWTKG